MSTSALNQLRIRTEISGVQPKLNCFDCQVHRVFLTQLCCAITVPIGGNIFFLWIDFGHELVRYSCHILTINSRSNKNISFYHLMTYTRSGKKRKKKIVQIRSNASNANIKQMMNIKRNDKYSTDMNHLDTL